MQTIKKVALDAMGGDNAPAEIVKGAVDAVSSREDIKVFLVGQEDVVREELQKYPYPQERIEVVDAPEVIEMAEPTVQAIRKKKQSSLVVGMNMVKQREADAFVSAGSSGRASTFAPQSINSEVPERFWLADRRLSDASVESNAHRWHRSFRRRPEFHC